MRLWLDLETRGTENLPRVGAYKYAESAEILLVSWAVDDAPVRVDEHPSSDFWDAFYEADQIVAHNAEFDRTVLAGYAEWGVRFDRWYCTMSQARRHGLPGGLGALCEILKVPEDHAKQKDGHTLLMLFCKPRPDGSWATKYTHPTEWARFVSYGGLDVEAMREVHRRCPKWNDEIEQCIWLADQRINARGFAVDLPFARAAIDQLKTVAKDTDDEVAERTGGDVSSGRQVQALIAHVLSEYGVDLPDMKAETLERRIADPDLPDEVRQLLALRQQSSKTSTSKYATLTRCASSDARIRGTITYSGAMRTKRCAGNRFQPHNLPRPKIGKLRGKALKAEIKHGISAVTAGVYDLVGTYPLPEVAASAIRGCVVAAPGKKLVIGDWSNVEGRALAWLAGEAWKLQAFRDYDTIIGEDENGEPLRAGADLYKRAYADAFGVALEDIDDFMRQVGKVMELMLGYGGGVAAFVTGAATYRVDLDTLVDTAWPKVPERVRAETAQMWGWAIKKRQTCGLSEMTFRTCDALKRMWREKHPKVVRFWQEVEDAFRAATLTGKTQTVGPLTFERVGAWLRVQGPMGDYISYPAPRVSDSGELSYLGQNQYTRKWSRIKTYGGKVCENITQWTCRNLLVQSHLNAEACGLPIVLHVHDENVAEVDKDRDDGVSELVACMTEISWADGLPLAVAAHEDVRYGKN